LIAPYLNVLLVTSTREGAVKLFSMLVPNRMGERVSVVHEIKEKIM
jgi:hypothetical protein